jgi:hypothetical protein
MYTDRGSHNGIAIQLRQVNQSQECFVSPLSRRGWERMGVGCEEEMGGREPLKFRRGQETELAN